MIKFTPNTQRSHDEPSRSPVEVPVAIMVEGVPQLLALPHVRMFLTVLTREPEPAMHGDGVDPAVVWERAEFKRFSVTRSLEGWDPCSDACSLFAEYNGAPATLIGFLQGVALSELLRELPLYHRPVRKVAV